MRVRGSRGLLDLRHAEKKWQLAFHTESQVCKHVYSPTSFSHGVPPINNSWPPTLGIFDLTGSGGGIPSHSSHTKPQEISAILCGKSAPANQHPALWIVHSPRVFTKVLIDPIAYLRQQEIHIHPYHGCSGLSMAPRPTVRLSSNTSITEGSPEAQGTTGINDSGGSLLAMTPLILHAATIVPRGTTGMSYRPRHASPYPDKLHLTTWVLNGSNY